MNDPIKWKIDPALHVTMPVIDIGRAEEALQSLGKVATLESYALLQMLQREHAHADQNDNPMFVYVINTTVRRLIELNGAVCGALKNGYGQDSPQSVADLIFGADGWRDARDPGNVTPAQTFGNSNATPQGGRS